MKKNQESLKVTELFAGIGATRKAFESIRTIKGIIKRVLPDFYDKLPKEFQPFTHKMAVDWNPEAVISYYAIHYYKNLPSKLKAVDKDIINVFVDTHLKKWLENSNESVLKKMNWRKSNYS